MKVMLNKKILTSVFLLVFLTLLVGCFPSPAPPITENQVPLIVSTPVTTAKIGVEYTYDVNATDPDEDVLTYSLTTKPTNMTINSATGVISWIPTSAQVGDNTVTVKVSDGQLSATQSFGIIVKAVEVELIEIKVAPDMMTLVKGGLQSFTVTAHYSDGSTADITYGFCTYQTTNWDIARVPYDRWVKAGETEGTATITVTYKGKIDKIEVTVSELPPLNQSPIASFTAIPTSGVAPLEVSFDASGSYDPDGNIVSYEWDFKDGNTGSGEIVNHTFSSTGNYNVKLTIIDNEGAVGSTTKTITVTETNFNNLDYLEGAIIIANDNEYLGKISKSQFDPDSINNQFGTYGSQFSAYSIFNNFGTYGSEFSSLSPFNKFTSTPPKIYKENIFIAYLTVNIFMFPRVDTNLLVVWLNE